MVRIFTLALFAVVLLSHAEAFADPRFKECDAYSKKAHNLGCEQDNFLIAFGHKYCREFIKRDREFSREGRAILAKIRSCLIERMNTNARLTCDNAKSEAQEDHFICYMESGFCDLDFFDQMTLLDTVFGELSDPEFMETSNRIAAGCGY